MKKIIKDTIDLDELNGARISTWISKLLNLQFQTGTSAIISAYAHADTPHDIGCTLEISYERLETDEEYEHRIERKEYLERIQIARRVEIEKQYAEKKAELEALELELKRGY